MKYNAIPKHAAMYLVTGLLLTSFTPILNKYLAMPDFIKGFLIGLGLTIEFIALVKIQRSKKENQRCSMLTILRK